jgi:hypothetical protein
MSLVWIWGISMLIIVLWSRANPEFFEDWGEDYIMAITTLVIGAPFFAITMVAAESFSFIYFLPIKIRLLWKISKIRDRKRRRELWKEIINI